MKGKEIRQSINKLFCSYVSRFRNSDKIRGEVAYFFTHMMAAVEFIEKMDRENLSVEVEEYDRFMEAAVAQFNAREVASGKGGDFDAKMEKRLEEAEAKAEELFLKAKEALKMTGEKAGNAFSRFKESSLAKKSMERIQRLVKDAEGAVRSVIDDDEEEQEEEKLSEFSGDKAESVKKRFQEEEEFQTQLAMALSLSAMENSASAAIMTDDLMAQESESENEAETEVKAESDAKEE